MIDYPYQWKIWYDDGSTFDSNDGSWEESPSRGVQVIGFLRPDTDDPKLGGRGWETASGEDFFRKTEDGHIVACNDNAMQDYVADVLGIIKIGRMLSAAEFRVIFAKASKELNILNKQGFTKQERKP